MSDYDYNKFMQFFERAALAWRNASEIRQGYLSLENFHPYGQKSYGNVVYRWRMSGAEDGGFEFRSLEQAEKQIADLLASRGVRP